MTAVPVSVLDTTPVVHGGTAAQALRDSVDLAVLADRLGFGRYWVAENHGMRGAAGSAPAVLAGRIADATHRIRVGAGGVLLPNHAPIVVAEQFGTLEVLHPGRIDLALGRARGGTRRATDLVRPDADRSTGGFRCQIEELGGYFEPPDECSPDEGPPDDGAARVVPAGGHRPELWVLGSGADSAALAGTLGLPFAFGAHLTRAPSSDAVQAYRSAFAPGRHLARPHLAVSVTVIAAETAARAEWLAGSVRLRLLRRARGQRTLLPDPADAAAHPADPDDRAEMERLTAHHVVGDGDGVRQRLRALVAATGADELVVTTPVHAHADRRRSYEVLADAWS